MRDYQRQKNNQYYLPPTLYRRVLAVVRDYDRQRNEIDEILYSTPIHDSVSSGAPSKPTESTAIRILRYQADVDAVENALEAIPAEYQSGVMDNIRYGYKFPPVAHYNTWLKWKQRFIYAVAKNLDLV